MKKDELISYIKKYLPFNCKIEIKNNNNHLILLKKKFFITDIKIHPVFLKADKNIIQDIINFIINKNNNCSKDVQNRIKCFFNNNNIKRKPKINHFYNFVDIKSLFDTILYEIQKNYNHLNFSDLKITWGKNYRNQKRCIRFGSFDKNNNLIRLHPKLDNYNIPVFFIKSIIYHEIAHFIIHNTNKTKRIHDKYFYEILNKIDPNINNSNNWEKNNKHLFFEN